MKIKFLISGKPDSFKNYLLFCSVSHYEKNNSKSNTKNMKGLSKESSDNSGCREVNKKRI